MISETGVKLRQDFNLKKLQNQPSRSIQSSASEHRAQINVVAVIGRRYMLRVKKRERCICFWVLWFLLGVTLWGVCLLYMFDDPLEMVGNYCSITFIAFIGAVIANATAVGGGFVFLPLFSLYYEIGSLTALKLALATQAFGMTSGALAWSGRLIDQRQLIRACLSSGFGMFIGTFYWMPAAEVVDLYFGWISLAVGAALLAELCVSRQPAGIQVQAKPIDRIGYLVACMLGGLVTAWVSIGVGEVVALWLIFCWRYSVAQGIATGVATLAFCSILGFLFHIDLGGIPWHYLIFTAPGVVVGGRVGASIGKRLTRPRSGDRRPAGFPLKAIVAAVIFIDGVIVLHQAMFG